MFHKKGGRRTRLVATRESEKSIADELRRLRARAHTHVSFGTRRVTIQKVDVDGRENRMSVEAHPR